MKLTLSQFKLSENREPTHESKLIQFKITNDNNDTQSNQFDKDKIKNKLTNS
jgi:hypothetical protein